MHANPSCHNHKNSPKFPMCKYLTAKLPDNSAPNKKGTLFYSNILELNLHLVTLYLFTSIYAHLTIGCQNTQELQNLELQSSPSSLWMPQMLHKSINIQSPA